MKEFKCRICGGVGDIQAYQTILNTNTPLAADVTEKPSPNMRRFPLHVVRCNCCGHVQLRESLDPSFYGDYLYTPSYASGFADYIDWFVKKLGNEVTKADRKVIEIGSSNGYLLNRLQKAGWTVLGVEPSETLAGKANAEGVKTFHGFFSKDTVDEIKNIIGQPDVLIFRHVMEHLDDLNDIADAIKELIGDGLLLIEVPYLRRIINENQFYAFFHEHLSYFSVTALNNLLSKAGLHIHKVLENDLEGGSILISANCSNEIGSDDNVDEYLENEKLSLSDDSIKAFVSRNNESIENMRDMITKAKEEKKKVAAWGGGQRGCTLISICGFQSEDIAYVIDVNKNYWDRYVPGTDIKIVPDDYYRSHPVDKIIIFATGYANSIIAEHSDFTDAGGEFVKII